ncbi:MAG: GIY-YIG nuclease family protein [Armatimonadetes bacterium]|nr:GIY-YIG nuclease family protein [Armatimonadota bacterium]
MPDLTDDELLAELGVEVEPAKKGKYTPIEERIIAGFEDIQRFYETHGHLPRHGEHLDIFERLYAVRLDRIRSLPEAPALIAQFDKFGLLGMSEDEQPVAEPLDDDHLLSELGVELNPETNVAVLKHVPSREERRAAEEIANRTLCEDFASFKPLFDRAEAELQAGIRQTKRFSGDINISQGEFFILGGQMAYVAERGPTFKTPNGEPDARLRLIYSNGTETNLLLRSLQRALYKDEAGRRLSDPVVPNLFSDEWEESDVLSGTIYVLRSKSDDPFIAQHRELVHKIGVTGGSVETRIANAKLDATFLLADVEIVATYKMSHIDRTKLEKILHRVFAPAQISITVEDRFGNPVQPKEWFLVPLHVIDEAIERIKDGSISGLVYDVDEVRLANTSELDGADGSE